MSFLRLIMSDSSCKEGKKSFFVFLFKRNNKIMFKAFNDYITLFDRFLNYEVRHEFKTYSFIFLFLMKNRSNKND